MRSAFHAHSGGDFWIASAAARPRNDETRHRGAERDDANPGGSTDASSELIPLQGK
jgi:hypothetical protein